MASGSTVPRASQPDSFQIYGYGADIGGLPLFYSGGNAYFGDYTLVDDNEAAPVVFTASDTTWLGSPNATVFSNSSSVPSWSNKTFAVPSSSSSTHEVGFVNGTTNSSSFLTDGFTFYGTFILVSGSNGELESLWYALPSDTDGIYALEWNSTSDSTDGKILLTLKRTPPSST
ncbi:hypothetical protein B0T10DRAFT_568447 [Thelonectria olida]|uniref:Uncharacterized protein n=1 Tax=Thelonectria olida TaxID=1576542 RepID=A0A9P8VQE7_9HYPO|nr:hypothetical protein B0T10DRAFT_568447 [Thelonectria olida]